MSGGFKPSGRLTLTQKETLKFFEYDSLEDLLVAKKDIRIPSDSLRVEELLKISEQTGFLSIKNNVTNLQFTLIDALSNTSGGFRPNNFFLVEAENNLVIQSDFSAAIPTANFTFEITTTQLAQTNTINLRTSGPVNNVRVKIVDTVSGIAFKFIPNRLSFDTGVDGIDLGTGIVPIDLGDSQLRFAPGRQLTITINADSTGFLGNASGVPWFSADLQRAEFRGIGWLQDAESIKKTSNFVAENGLTYLIDTTSNPVLVEITDDVNEFWVGDWETTWSNSNDVTVDVGTDQVVSDAANKGKMFRFTRQGSVFRVYDGDGGFRVEANI